MASIVSLIIELVVAILMIAIAVWTLISYNKKVWKIKPTLSQLQPKPQPLANQPNFLEGLCGCFDNPNICLTTWFCGICRNVDSQVTAGVLGREEAMQHALLQAFCGCIYVPFFHPCKRAAMRAQLGGHPEWTCTDVLTSLCLFNCSLCQEAREVDKAANAETRFVSCALTQYGNTAPIGQAIMVQP